MKKIKVALLCPVKSNHISGPVNSVSNTSLILKEKLGLYCEVFTTQKESFIYNNVVFKSIKNNFSNLRDFDLVVFSGVWVKDYINISKFLSACSIPYFITPRSSLMKRQFYKSFFKKSLFLIGGGYKFLLNAKFIHFLTEEEKFNSIFNNKAEIIPNPLRDEIVERFKFYDEFILKKRFIYLGRFQNYHKGLDLLLAAVNSCQQEMRLHGWTLTLAGPDNINDLKKLISYSENNGLTDIVNFENAKQGREKLDYLLNADVFMCTSRYEGQPQALMEALLAFNACIVTKGSNMADYTTSKEIGFLVDNDPKSIAESMIRFMRMDNKTLNKMKISANLAMLQDFSEQKVAYEFSKVINTLLDSNI
jgi:glycosyltransferase involved in cell wall biosynthesis